ncbi:hypothetical protein ARMA_2946 [Ardenticatena maritima]|uniref:Uncharacterized protein n=1 Tax=Ardenticatena maritima TaxID=872965 RepID=A0A0M8K9G0_9CHLR|nr:hypothetical protein ARMA_2946 [Ardenticatena maritima]
MVLVLGKPVSGFNPLAGIRAFQTKGVLAGTIGEEFRFNPLAGIRAFQTYFELWGLP